MSKNEGGNRARIAAADEGMAEAVATLRAGGLVAFPTETVYGLGANALDAGAVAKIFAAKGRPATNPLIVHVADAAAARKLAANWPGVADALTERFWPGPLTLVVPKSPDVPDIVTAGGATVGLRVPAHPVALRLIREAGIPVAAPSANRSEEVSPTTARHVANSLGPHVDDLLILDGGPADVGIESTVLDLTADPPRILRPGMVTAEMLCEILSGVAEGGTNNEPVPRSPGQMLRHYAPRAMVTLLNEEQCDVYVDGATRPYDDTLYIFGEKNGRSFHTHIMPAETPEDYAFYFYSVLRELDEEGADHILIEEPPHGPEWAAIHDRLRRAAAPRDEADSPSPIREAGTIGRGGQGVRAGDDTL